MEPGGYRTFGIKSEGGFAACWAQRFTWTLLIHFIGTLQKSVLQCQDRGKSGHGKANRGAVALGARGLQEQGWGHCRGWRGCLSLRFPAHHAAIRASS